MMRNVLYEKHKALGAKFIEFGGWEMPLQYQGIITEHLNVREKVGMFDVSHMGRIIITGPDAEPFMDYLSTNSIIAKPNNSATYTVWPNVDGSGCVDDLIVYKQDPTHFFVVVNASNRQKDLNHLKEQANAFQVEIAPCYDQEGILSIQGPLSEPLLSQFFPEASQLKHMRFATVSYTNQSVILSRTGYTGSDGFEIYAPNSIVEKLWDELLTSGKAYGIMPTGLGARDTLRLEMGYALYGHEITDEIAANESVSAWTIKWEKINFMGREGLEKIEESPHKRSEYGIILTDPGIARAGYRVYQDGVEIGYVTSGTQSPSLHKAIAIIIVEQPLQIGEEVEIQIRENRSKAKVVALPFI